MGEQTTRRPEIFRVIFWLGMTLALIIGFGALDTVICLDWTPEASGAATERLYQRLAQLGGLALVIDRAVQTILRGLGLNGTERSAISKENPKTKDASVPATVISFSLGLGIALSGVGLLDVFGAVQASCGQLGRLKGEWIWHGVDVFVTAALLSGGAASVHKLAEELKLMLPRFLGTEKYLDSRGFPEALPEMLVVDLDDGGIARLTTRGGAVQGIYQEGLHLPAGRYRGRASTRLRGGANELSIDLPFDNWAIVEGIDAPEGGGVAVGSPEMAKMVKDLRAVDGTTILVVVS